MKYDIRFMGGLSIYMPFTSSNLMVSNFAICGMPFLAGFYSRDFILEIFSIRSVNMFGTFTSYDAHLANYTLYNRFLHNMICCHNTLFTKTN